MLFILIIPLRIMNVFLPGKMETVVDFDCVPTYTRKLVAQIVDMENSVIVQSYSFKAGTFEFGIRISKLTDALLRLFLKKLKSFV